MNQTYRDDKKVLSFIENVEKQLYTEESSNQIREELLDHIECLVEDFIEAGHDIDLAISKALLQMGDPQEIGYSFTDFDGLKSRKRIMMAFKISSMLVLSLTIVFGLLHISSSPSESDSNSVSSMISLMMNSANLLLIFSSGTLLLGKSTKIFELDTTPHLILWPSKSRFPWEYLILLIFFMPIIIIFFILYFVDYGITSTSILGMWPLLTISYSVWAFIYSEKFRMPKYMIIDEGIVLKGRFLSWTAITSYRFGKDFFAKNNEDYKLTIESFQKHNPTVPIRKSISIHKRQYAQVHKYLSERT